MNEEVNAQVKEVSHLHGDSMRSATSETGKLPSEGRD